MSIQTISFDDFSARIFHLWGEEWFILTAGNYSDNKFNSMTIAWGSMGIMWEKPFVQVVVRPSRYTLGFMEANPDFSICAFPEQYRKALQLIGSRSGRDGDKIKESGLTPCKSSLITAPSFVEANLVIECRKMYADMFKSQSALDPSIDAKYPLGDYHRFYFGEILTIRGDRSIYC